jgi:hypothetical protein
MLAQRRPSASRARRRVGVQAVHNGTAQGHIRRVVDDPGRSREYARSSSVRTGRDRVSGRRATSTPASTTRAIDARAGTDASTGIPSTSATSRDPSARPGSSTTTIPEAERTSSSIAARRSAR